jgi:DNA-binding beta-propeller fold protein YncE
MANRQSRVRAVAGAAAVLFAAGIALPQGGQEGELWVTSQGTDRLFIVQGKGASIETVSLPAGAGPHITTFGPSGEYAYVSGMGNGDLFVLRAEDRQLLRTLDLGAAGTHQAKPSPDGSFLLVAQIPSKTLVKVAADEAGESWTVLDSLSLAPLGKPPICTVFRDDGHRAYVSMLPDGIAIVDVPSMTIIGTLATDGFVACGMIKSKKGGLVTVASSGGGGHLYRLDTATDLLTDAGTLGAADWHSFAMSRNEKVGFGSSPHSDELVLADLSGEVASPLAILALDPTPGLGNDQPDALAVHGDTVYVSLRASGKVAVVKWRQQEVVRLLDLSPAAPFNPANCAGCAVHGVAVRP